MKRPLHGTAKYLHHVFTEIGSKDKYDTIQQSKGAMRMWAICSVVTITGAVIREVLLSRPKK